MNYILGKFTTDEELQQAENRLKELGFVSSKTNKNSGDALRLFNKDSGNTFTSGDYDNYLKYKKSGMSPYVECEVLSLEDFIKTLQKDSKPSLNERKLAHQKELEKREVNSFIENLNAKASNMNKGVAYTFETKPFMPNDEVHIDKSKLLNTYSKVSHELKAFLRLLFGDELFVEPTYKVGDKFSRKGETLVIVKINQNVVTLVDCKTFENVRTSKQVADVNAITESELRCLLGVWRDEFNLIK